MGDIDTTGFDDTEIDQLENIRRYGKYNDIDDTEYFTLPPKRVDMMKDWKKWRTNINDIMSDLIGKKSTGRDTLTIEARMKAPDFFKGSMSIHGQRLKDEYGGRPIDEQDDQNVRIEKKIIDENFFLFGIPRISLQRASTLNTTTRKPQRDKRRHSESEVHASFKRFNNHVTRGNTPRKSIITEDQMFFFDTPWEK